MSEETEPNVLEVFGAVTLTVLPILGIAYVLENYIIPFSKGTFVISPYWQGVIDSTVIMLTLIIIFATMALGPRRGT